MVDVVDGKQLTMFGIPVPTVGTKPTPEEIAAILANKVRIVIHVWHRGRPPKGMTFEDLGQEVSLHTLHRLRNFRHGGRFTLGEFTYVAACWALRDIQRIDVRRARPAPDYPLLAAVAAMPELEESA